MVLKELSEKEVRQAAHINHSPGEEIKDQWNHIYKDECAKINRKHLIEKLNKKYKITKL
jgi:hypothetical protein